MDSNNPNWVDNVETRPHPRPGLNWLTTSISCSDVKIAVDFYTQALKMVSIFTLPDEKGEVVFARLRYRGINFILNKEGFDSEYPSPTTENRPPLFIFYLYVDDITETVKSMQLLGAEVIFFPKEEFWGDLRSRLKDPFGYIWDIAQKVNK